MPATAQRGEIVTIRAMIAHAMETGFRRTQLGALIPRDIITRFICTYNGA
ncbi:MAG: thiosulfate oxidation carrier complex protein SoxZ, partial [Burkholderiales bacterium]|nr:thiosulfate oxidation carrier complex protein SoxZ [Burkholderiales bacterium]